jgi:hypothetical protein
MSSTGCGDSRFGRVDDVPEVHLAHLNGDDTPTMTGQPLRPRLLQPIELFECDSELPEDLEEKRRPDFPSRVDWNP